MNKPGVVPAAVPALAITVALALASYYLIELPFLRRKPRPRAIILHSAQRASRVRCAEPGSLTVAQKTGVSRHTPHTSRSASHISPSVT